MKCISEIKILGSLIALLQVSALTAKEVNKEIQVPLEGDFPDSSTRCGDVLQASSGTISYKSFTPVSPNERCVWTVRNPNATGYGIAVDNLGKSSSVIISAISVGNISMQTFIPTVTSTSYTIVNGSVLVIAFYRTSTTEPGFTLRYRVNTLEGIEGPTSREVVARADAGHIKHPLGYLTYSNYDLSVFVFAPLNGIVDMGKSTEVIYIRDSLEGQACYDMMRVYIFDINQSGSNKWKLLGDMCGGVDSEVVSSNDLIMMIFKSDQSNEYAGFHLYARSI